MNNCISKRSWNLCLVATLTLVVLPATCNAVGLELMGALGQAMAEAAAQQAELERIRLNNQMQMEREQVQMQRLEYERRLVAEKQEYERRKAFEQQQKQQAIADAEYKNKQRQLLTLSHSNWQELIQTEEYQAWFFQLPSDTQAALANTWDSDLTIKAISAFKDWKKSRKKHNNSK